MTVEALTAQALRPLDELRRTGLRVLAAGGPWTRALIRRRSTRVQVLLSAHALAAISLTVLAPSFLLAVGPLVLAVPHLTADVRHLLIRRAWPRGWLAACAAFAVGLVGLQAVDLAGTHPASPAVAQGAGAAWVVLAAVAGTFTSAGRRPRAWLALAGAVALTVAAVCCPRAFRIALVHGHNLVAIALWMWLFRRGNRLAWLPVAIVLAGGAVLATGALTSFTVRHGALMFGDLHLFAAADWLAPGLPDGTAVALAMSFAFLQSTHYAIWLIGVPAGDRPGEGARSLRVAARDFVGDLRPAGAAAVVLLTTAVAVAGLLHPAPARRLILSLGMFHAWLELAVLAYLIAAGPHAARSRSGA